MSKVKVKGKLTWIGEKEYKGRRYWRVGIVPEGEDEALFLNVNGVPGAKGEVVTIEVTEEAMEKARGSKKTQPPEGSPEKTEGRADKARETESRIAKAVALKAAADAIAAITHTDISTLGKNVLKLAAEFEDYLNGVPF